MNDTGGRLGKSLQIVCPAWSLVYFFLLRIALLFLYTSREEWICICSGESNHGKALCWRLVFSQLVCSARCLFRGKTEVAIIEQ